MLVNDKPYEMVGYLSAIDDGPGFVVPLFMNRNSNMLLVQEIGDDDAVHNFREVEPRSFQRLNGTNQFLSLGDRALWGFHLSNARPLIMERDRLREQLLLIIDAVNPPFLKLQVAQFCDNQAEVIAAWRTAFEHLEQCSPRSAQAWRDVVVIPTQMRLAVESAIIANGLDASIKHLNRTVEVNVEGGHLRLRLKRDLYGELIRHPAAMASLERNATPIREAFQLSSNKVSLVPYQAGSDEKFDEEVSVDDFAIAGFGTMALSLIAQVFPRIKRSPDGRRSYALGPLRDYAVKSLLQRDEMSGSKDWWEERALELNSQNRTLLVLCQLGPEHTRLLDDAIRFASLHRDKRRRIIVVIPHLPTEFEEPGELARSVVPMLHREFDGVWALSDRSPYTRQSLTYGPARSSQAAAAHFRYLIRVAQDKGLRDDLVLGARNPSAINVIGSATGNKDVLKLVGDALLRLRHHLFDFRTVTSGRVQMQGSEKLFGAVVREVVQREAPAATVQILATPKGDGGPNRVLVSLSSVSLLPGGDEAFERYCVDQLKQFDWRIDQFEANGFIHASQRGVKNLPIECKYVAAGSFESLYKNQRRLRVDDGIVLTNAAIRRRTFARWVLSGAVPVHSSRVEALYRIYRRRYSYALTYLHQEAKTAERIIIPAAIDWLNLTDWFTAKNVGRASATPDKRPNLEIRPSSMALSLALEVNLGRGAKKSTTLGRADILLDENGWHLHRLNIADEWVYGA